MYHHTQTSQLIRLVVALAAAAGYVGLALATSWLMAAPFLIALLWAAVTFSSLTIKVTDDALVWHFGNGFWRKIVSVKDIRSVAVVQNRWWYGWGVHLTPHGWLYNVSGLEAVEVHTRAGRVFRLGTAEPEALRDALHGRMSP